MQLAHAEFRQVPGLKFHKLMGSGGKGGFGLWPNWNVFALLGVWENIDAYRAFEAKNTFAQKASELPFLNKSFQRMSLWPF